MIKQALFGVYCIMLLIASVSCASGQRYKGEDFVPSKTYAAVQCATDSSQSYALFLPPQYEKGKPSPVLILFDPSGNGLLPVNLFSDEAARSGFIIAGSNNSKNGMPFNQTTAIYRNLLSDLTSRFTIGKKAIYLGGFSGGSRVAGGAAITEGGVAGVIGCGAGLNNTNSKPVGPFSYLAVVGNQDFNYAEMLQLDESLDYAGYQHHLLVFDGIHQWPPKSIIPEIFTWLRFDAMRQQAIPADRNEINLFVEKNDKKASDFESVGNLPGQQDTYIKMMHFLQGLTDVTPLQSEIARLAGAKKVIALRKLQKELLGKEKELQNQYSSQLQIQTTDWWKTEATRLRALSVKAGDSAMNQVYKRVLGFLSLDCYMYANNALKQSNLDAANRCIEIYRLVDPTNPEHRYMAAKVAALNHNPDALISALKQAFNLGFKDIKRIQSDADFLPYQEHEKFKGLLSGR